MNHAVNTKNSLAPPKAITINQANSKQHSRETNFSFVVNSHFAAGYIITIANI